MDSKGPLSGAPGECSVCSVYKRWWADRGRNHNNTQDQATRDDEGMTGRQRSKCQCHQGARSGESRGQIGRGKQIRGRKENRGQRTRVTTADIMRGLNTQHKKEGQQRVQASKHGTNQAVATTYWGFWTTELTANRAFLSFRNTSLLTTPGMANFSFLSFSHDKHARSIKAQLRLSRARNPGGRATQQGGRPLSRHPTQPPTKK